MGRRYGEGAGIEVNDLSGILGTLGGDPNESLGGEVVLGEETKSPKGSASETFLDRIYFGFGGVGGGGGEEFEPLEGGGEENVVAVANGGVSTDTPPVGADAKSPKSSSSSSSRC